jgi:predicted heme/steroid binding protein/uncharacterized membrane protein
MREMDKEFTLAELAAADGTDGKPAHIAYQGRVFDVSQSSLWTGGRHMDRHRAGQDLTGAFANAPHGLEVFQRYPQVGVLQTPAVAAGADREKAPEIAIPGWLSRLLRRFPLLKRHPHPMLVHFPIVFMIAATAFNLLYLLTGRKSFELTALNCLGGGVLFTPAAILTGLLSWWLNYQTRRLRPVTIKLILSPILLGCGLLAFIWRLVTPGIMDNTDPWHLVYLLLIFLLAPLVATIGWFGAQITFPIHEE